MLKLVLKMASFAGLILTIVPAFLVFTQSIDLDFNKNLMVLGTLLWFGTSPFWMNKNKQN